MVEPGLHVKAGFFIWEDPYVAGGSGRCLGQLGLEAGPLSGLPSDGPPLVLHTISIPRARLEFSPGE